MSEKSMTEDQPRPRPLSTEPGRAFLDARYVTATIAQATALSDVVRIRGERLAGIIMPAAWTAAGLSFKAGADEVTLYDVYDDNPAGATEITVGAAASRYVALTGTRLDALGAVDFLQVRSGTTGSPVNQAAERALILVLK